MLHITEDGFLSNYDIYRNIENNENVTFFIVMLQTAFFIKYDKRFNRENISMMNR